MLGGEGVLWSIMEAPVQLGDYPVTRGDASAWSRGPWGVLEERVLPQGGAQGLTLLLVLQQREPPWSTFHFSWMSKVCL